MINTKAFETTNTSQTINQPFTKPFDELGTIFIAVVLITFLVLCLILNIVTIYVISKTKTLRNDKFTMVICSLCCSDLFSTLISWIWLHRRTWGFDDFNPVPAFFCKIYWAGDFATNYVTALHIFLFAIMRFIAIKYPIQFKRLKRNTLKNTIVIIWIFSFLVGFIPLSIWTVARMRDRDSNLPDARWPACTFDPKFLPAYKIYVYIVFPIFICLPVVGVVALSFLITLIVMSYIKTSEKKFVASGTRTPSKINSVKKQHKKQKQAILQLLLIAFCFIIGYIPIFVYEMWSMQDLPNNDYYKYLDYWFGVGAYIALRFSETMNPIFYNLGSPKIRAHTMQFLRNKLKVKFIRRESIPSTSIQERGMSLSQSHGQENHVKQTVE